MCWWNQGIYLTKFTRVALLGLGTISGLLEYRVCPGGVRWSICPISPGLLCWVWGQSQNYKNIEYVLVESGDLFAQFHQDCFAGAGAISGLLEYRVCVGGIRGSIWPSSPGLLCWGWGQSQDCWNIEYVLVESGDLFAQFHQGCFAESGDNLRTIRI